MLSQIPQDLGAVGKFMARRCEIGLRFLISLLWSHLDGIELDDGCEFAEPIHRKTVARKNATINIKIYLWVMSTRVVVSVWRIYLRV